MARALQSRRGLVVDCSALKEKHQESIGKYPKIARIIPEGNVVAICITSNFLCSESFDQRLATVCLAFF